MQPAPPGFGALALADLIADTCQSEVIGHCDWHLVLVCGGRRRRFWVRECTANEPSAYVQPVGDRGQRRAAGGCARQPGLSERWRLAQWLRLLDAIDAGASPREQAAALIAPGARHMSSAAWDASSERRRIARWQREARAMRDGGYQRLLAAS